MKYIAFLFSFFAIANLAIGQEDVKTYLASAETKYKAGNLEEARFELEQALAELDKVIGQAVLEVMPQQLGELQTQIGDDSYTGNNLGYAGLFVSRYYKSADATQELEVTLMNDSPLLASLNAFLTSSFAAMTGQKVVKVNGYKGALERLDGSNPVEYKLNIPFGQSLLTLNFTGIKDEAAVLQLANQFPIAKIVELTK